ncbi:MAG: antA/AntB antirepressor family protein [Deltaproteobacteria bacterium]|nr:antA/AntB antirepressor family protein [Deltaproteobacteria bacterium]
MKHEKQLIPIQTRKISNQDVPTVDARELHEFLEVKTKFADWINSRIEEYGFIEDVDFFCFRNLGSKDGRGGHNRIEYQLTIGMGKELSMVEKNPKGQQARRYFIACENQLRETSRAGTVTHAAKAIAEKHVAMIRTFKGYRDVAKIAGLESNQVILASDKAVRALYGESCLALVDATHLLNDMQQRHCNATELGQIYGGITALQMNKLLTEAGLQKKIIVKPGKNGSKDTWKWAPTEKGKLYSVIVDAGKANHIGAAIQQVRWYESVLAELRPAIAAA